MELFDAALATLFYYRHDCSQEVTGVVFGVSQPTISRMVNALEEPIAAVLDCEVPELVEVITGRVIIPDGPLFLPAIVLLLPSCTPASGTGAGRRSRFCPALTADCATSVNRSSGSIHDVRAFCETGLAAVLAEHMDSNLVIADLGYRGEPVVTPVKKPPKGELSPAQIKANKHLSSIRSAVERCIAHLKNWKILTIRYRRPLRKLALCLATVAALEFYRLNWVKSE